MEELKKQNRLDAMSPVDRLFEEFRQGNNDELDVANALTNAMEKENKNIDKSLYVETAERIKKIRVDQKKWTRQKKRNRERVRFIESILGEN